MAKRRKKSARYKNKEFLKALGAHVRRTRIQKGFSIDRLAKEGEQLSPGAVHRLEMGESDCQISLLYRISDVLEVPPKELLNFDFNDT